MSDYLVSVWLDSIPAEHDPDTQIVVYDAADADEAMEDGCAELGLDPDQAGEVMAEELMPSEEVVTTWWGTFEE
ncbi:MAG: hypothetical protein JO202_19400 [Ktedonobacteraceae bacterium]|nr:hypothetical protein [Ktedonobacteraceae bacterium]